MKRQYIIDKNGKMVESSFDKFKGFFSRFWPALIIPAIILVLWGVSAIVDSIHFSIVENRVITQYDGVTPYENAYGPNMVYASNTIYIHASADKDVVVIIREKTSDRVVGHIYVKAGEEGFMAIPDGVFNVFFYEGRGWDPDKIIKSSRGDHIKGGFKYEAVLGKDPRELSFGDGRYNQISYDLNKRRYGNMHERKVSKRSVF